MSEGKKLPQYVAACCICLGAMGTGTVIAWSSNIISKLQTGELAKTNMNEDQLGLVASMMPLGATIVCMPVGVLADMFGRKFTVLASTIPFILGWLLITVAANIYMVYAGRFLTGMAGGTFAVIAPLYTSEIAQTEIRGRLGTFFQLFITIGILLSNVFGHVLPMIAFNIFCLLVPIVFAIAFFFQPETPVYSLKKGKAEQANKAYKRLRGGEYNPAEEIKVVEETIAKEQNRKNFWEGMKSKAAKKATLICFSLMFFQQFSGINAVMFYAEGIFRAADPHSPAARNTIIIGAVQVVATVISSYLVEKVGRKVLLSLSNGFMSISTFLLGIYFSISNNQLVSKDTLKSISFIPIMSLIIFIIAFSMGAGPIPWLASSEIFPADIKAKCSSAAGAFNWFLAFLVTIGYKVIADRIGNDPTFYFFSVISLIGVFFVLFIMPETRGKTFAEIQAELEG